MAFILPIMSLLNAESSSDLFHQANKKYRSGSFKEAKKLYQQMPKKNAFIEYNIGNCAYKLGKYGQAMLHWKRAENNWGFFNRSELLANIQLLQEKLNLRTPIEQHGYIISKLSKLKRYTFSLLRTMPLLAIQLLFLALWLFLFVYLRFLYKKRQKLIIRILFTLIATIGIILIFRHSLAARQYGIVMKNQSPILSGPGNSFQTLLYLPEAKEIIIKHSSDEYLKIKSDRQIGWIHNKNIEKV